MPVEAAGGGTVAHAGIYAGFAVGLISAVDLLRIARSRRIMGSVIPPTDLEAVYEGGSCG